MEEKLSRLLDENSESQTRIPRPSTTNRGAVGRNWVRSDYKATAYYHRKEQEVKLIKKSTF